MFRFQNRQMGYGVGDAPQTDDYDGTGIWYPDAERGVRKRIKETPEFRDLLEEQCSRIGDSSAALYREFDIANPEGRWQVTPDQARFTFTTADGRTSHARYGVIGSYNPQTENWMWAWHFPEDWMPAPAVRLSMEMFQIGAACGWRALTEPVLYLGTHEAWHLTKLAAHLAGYPMVYSAMVNDVNRHFFAIDRPVWLV